MILLLNITNKLIQGAISDGISIQHSFTLKTKAIMTEDECYLALKPFLEDIDETLVASVVPSLNSIFRATFENLVKIPYQIVGPGIKTGIMCKTTDPHSVGTDLILAAAGSLPYGDRCLVIDMGLATKYIFREHNVITGSSIAPGFTHSLRALVNSAALLQDIELSIPPHILENNTRSCVQSGAIYGTASMIDGMIERIQIELNRSDFDVLITGKYASLFLPLCKHKLILVDNLSLEGLLYIYQKNTKTKNNC